MHFDRLQVTLLPTELGSRMYGAHPQTLEILRVISFERRPTWKQFRVLRASIEKASMGLSFSEISPASGSGVWDRDEGRSNGV